MTEKVIMLDGTTKYYNELEAHQIEGRDDYFAFDGNHAFVFKNNIWMELSETDAAIIEAAFAMEHTDEYVDSIFD